MRSRPKIGFAALLVSVLLVAGLAVAAASRRSGGASAPPAPPHRRWADYALFDADATGAVVLDRANRSVSGYNAVGKRVWRSQLSAIVGEANCLRQCPDAVLSSSADSLFQFQEPDPPVVYVTGAGRVVTQTRTPDAAKATVWGAASQTQSVTITSTMHGTSALVLTSSGRPDFNTSIPLQSFATVDRSVKHVLLRPLPGRVGELRWYELSTHGWSLTSHGSGLLTQACFNGDGSLGILADNDTARIVAFGGRVVASLNGASGVINCGWDSAGPVLALGGGSNSTVVAQFDERGHQLWQATLATLGSISVMNSSPLVVFSGPGTATVLSCGNGKALHTWQGVASALVADRSHVVVLDSEGVPSRFEVKG